MKRKFAESSKDHSTTNPTTRNPQRDEKKKKNKTKNQNGDQQGQGLPRNMSDNSNPSQMNNMNPGANGNFNNFPGNQQGNNQPKMRPNQNPASNGNPNAGDSFSFNPFSNLPNPSPSEVPNSQTFFGQRNPSRNQKKKKKNTQNQIGDQQGQRIPRNMVNSIPSQINHVSQGANGKFKNLNGKNQGNYLSKMMIPSQNYASNRDPNAVAPSSFNPFSNFANASPSESSNGLTFFGQRNQPGQQVQSQLTNVALRGNNKAQTRKSISLQRPEPRPYLNDNPKLRMDYENFKTKFKNTLIESCITGDFKKDIFTISRPNFLPDDNIYKELVGKRELLPGMMDKINLY